MLSTNESVPNNDVQRWNYDLTHYSHTCGNIGGLQTISVIPTLPGDSFDITCKMQFKLSPLVRSLSQDAIVDMYAFWVPHRHIYTDWATWLKGGYDEGTTLGSLSTGPSVGIACVGRRIGGSETVPTWLLAGYSRIWNRYFKHPATADFADNGLLSAAASDRYYGRAICHIKTPWNTGVADTTTTADRDYTISGSVVDLPDFALQQARLKTELDRDWFSVRYKDLLENTWGGDANIDGDQRPDLLMRSSQYLSAWDVESTDTAAVGSYTGRAAGIGELTIPRRFIPEHGVIWLMCSVRMPPVAATEIHFLTTSTRAEPTYQNTAADPEVIMNSEPVEVTTADFFQDGSSTVLNRIPYGQWWRYQPSHVHVNYSTLTGHPFLTAAPASTDEALYIDNTMYEPMFSNLNLAQWHGSAHISVDALRCVPPPKASIYAGTRK